MEAIIRNDVFQGSKGKAIYIHGGMNSFFPDDMENRDERMLEAFFRLMRMGYSLKMFSRY